MSSSKPTRDYFYLAIVLMHLTAMLGVDFVPFYPQILRQSPNSPFHAYRNWYITTMSDPYYNIETPGHFFDFFVFVELLVEFPLALYLARVFSAKKPPSGLGELATILYGTITGLTTATVCHDMWFLGPEYISREAKNVLLFAAYLPYAIIPTLMVMDMSLRLLSRLEDPPRTKSD